MTAKTKDTSPALVYRGEEPIHRRPWAGKVKQNAILYLGALCMMVDGVATPLVSGSGWVAGTNCTAYGATNAGIVVTARRKGVKLALIDPSANSKPLLVTVTRSTVYTTVNVQLATSNMGAITSTAADVGAALRQHAEASELLRVAQAGDGSGTMAAVAAADVKAVEVLGVRGDYQIDATGAADLAIAPDVTWRMNEPGFGMGFYANATPPVEGGEAILIDDQTVSATLVSDLDLRAPCTGTDAQQDGVATFYFVDLTRAK